jgi:predicted RNA binding protein YcfA (HicA-like mRNA interferase family)
MRIGRELPLPLIRGILEMPLSGKEMLRLYERNGWIFLRQKGSHVMVEKGRETECIPMHKELRYGMEAKLLKHLREVG